jgi:GntR family transcriptional regulator, carbon starvation induced regulator
VSIKRSDAGPLSSASPRSGGLAPTRSGQAYLALRSDILAGAIEPGSKLKMEELQRRYRLSSSPLREALNRLAAEQIVTVDERRGFRAALVSQADLSDITRFRLVLEASAFQESIAHGSFDWEAAVIAALHRLESLQKRLPAQTRSQDPAWIESHKAFHTALLSACGSHRLLATGSALFDQSQRYRALSAQHRAVPRNSRAEHRRLAEAAMRHDLDLGPRLLREHIQKTADQVSTYLAEAGSGPADGSFGEFPANS